MKKVIRKDLAILYNALPDEELIEELRAINALTSVVFHYSPPIEVIKVESLLQALQVHQYTVIKNELASLRFQHKLVFADLTSKDIRTMNRFVRVVTRYIETNKRKLQKVSGEINPVSWVIQAIFQSRLSSNVVVDKKGRYTRIIDIQSFEVKLRQLKIIKGGLNATLKKFLGQNDFVNLRKLIKASQVFLKSDHLKSYGITKNRLQ